MNLLRPEPSPFVATLAKSVVLSIALALTGCSHDPGVFVWVDDLKENTASADYVIRPGDLISVRVFQQDNMSARSRVRGDGKISMPFLNDVTVAGFTPTVLAAQLQTRLKEFINNPVVTISLEEVRAQSVSIIGEISKPGIYPLTGATGLLSLLAASGGFTTFAKKNVYVMRTHLPGSPPQRIRFDYEKLSKAEGRAATFLIQDGDVVLVE